MRALLQQYKAFVRQHPSLVQNAERLLHWLVWNPERFSGSEYAYESFNAAVGLLGIYNDSILSEHPGQQHDVAHWAFWLAAVEQVQTLIELRAIHLEERGKMNRYGPLLALEVLKCALRLALWRSSKCTLAMEEVTREDQEQHECQSQLKELLEALVGLRQRYDYKPATAPTEERLQYNAHLAHAAAVRASAVAPHRPPAACAAAGQVQTSVWDPAVASKQQQPAKAAVLGSLRCAVCGSEQGSRSTSSCSSFASGQQQLPEQQSCQVCGRPLSSTSHKSSSGQDALPGLSEISPAEQPAGKHPVDCGGTGNDDPADSSKSSSSSSKSHRKLWSRGWWSRAAGAGDTASKQHSEQQQQPSSAVQDYPGALPGSWGPALRPYPSLSPLHDRAEDMWQQQHQQPAWSLSHRDSSIGQSVMWAGELVHVLKPLVYVVMLRRYGLTSWKPWFTMLTLDVASGYGLHTGHAILLRSNASKWPGGSTLFSLALLRGLSSGQWSPGEQQELMARRMQLLRYLLRSPCYTGFTRHMLLKAVAGCRWVPGLSSLAEFAFSMVEGMQSYYTYVEC